MAQNEQNNNKEIDLTEISRHMKRYYARVGDSFFNSILFVQRNIILFAIIIVFGVGLGYFLDKGSKSYSHKIFVIPNFGSVDYVYNEVEHIDKKIGEGDVKYLKSIGIHSPKKLGTIKIEPVIDIYSFLDNTEQDQANRRLELFELIAEQGDVKKVLEEDVTSKNYKTHLITIRTSSPVAPKEIIEPLLEHLNANKYFKQIQKEYVANTDIKLAANEQMIRQIDSVVNNFNKAGSSKSAGLMYYNDNTQLNELFKVKNTFVLEQQKIRINKLNYDYIVKQTSVVSNTLNVGATTGRMKFIVPLFFIFVFVVVVRFVKFYKRKLHKYNEV